MRSILCPLIFFTLPAVLSAQQGQIMDAYPDKSRYAPGEAPANIVELSGIPAQGDTLVAFLLSDGREVGHCAPLILSKVAVSKATLACVAPADDFRGYLVDVSIRSADGGLLSSRTTVIDISSDWKRFPRYGYLAHYNVTEDAKLSWIAEMTPINGNRHINARGPFRVHPNPKNLATALTICDCHVIVKLFRGYWELKLL